MTLSTRIARKIRKKFIAHWLKFLLLIVNLDFIKQGHSFRSSALNLPVHITNEHYPFHWSNLSLSVGSKNKKTGIRWNAYSYCKKQTIARREFTWWEDDSKS